MATAKTKRIDETKSHSIDAVVTLSTEHIRNINTAVVNRPNDGTKLIFKSQRPEAVAGKGSVPLQKYKVSVSFGWKIFGWRVLVDGPDIEVLNRSATVKTLVFTAATSRDEIEIQFRLGNMLYVIYLDSVGVIDHIETFKTAPQITRTVLKIPAEALAKVRKLIK